MIERLFSRGPVSTLEAVLAFASKRHQVIATNIANVDTTGYRTRDLAELGSVDAGVLKPNGNNVDLEIEMAKMARNNALHSMAAALLAQQFTLLREAISGQLHS
jgi:flagellar basal body rod protein FlgB